MDVLAKMLIGTLPPGEMELVGAEALNQFPPETVLDVMVKFVAAVPKLLNVELPLTVPCPEPLDRATDGG